eukprot:TRINITY_DN2563_c0_g1_i1.p1 TRINITY_DN2563_c0_g1~~TRINITY_DN2563_c0_g1_i1.p1  ORF type:complete len:473 (-),score=82.78 TRINITY_DN2563_c0_g1_i1:117-1535(-)
MASLMKKGSLLSTSCGSPHYASPEVVQGVKYDGSAADVWSCGVILYALLTGKLPFDDDNIRRLLNKVKSGIFSMPPVLHKDIKDLIWKMLVVDPTKRITISQIKENSWFRSNHLEMPMTLNMFEIVDVEIDVSNLDEEVIKSLHSLGWGSEDEVKQSLLVPNQIQRFFYQLLLERKNSSTESLYHAPLQRGRVCSAPSPVIPSSPMMFSPHISNPNTAPSPRPLRVITQIPVVSNLSILADTMTPPASPLVSNTSKVPDRRNRNGDERNSEGRPGRFLSLSGTHLPAYSALNPNPSSNSSAGEVERVERNRERRSSLTSSGGSIGISINNTSNRFHRMKIESQNNTPPGSPIVGSSPKRSWFSTFFSNSERGNQPKKGKSFSIQSTKSIDLIISNLQTVFKKYHIIWDTLEDNIITARHRSLSSPTSLKFNAEVRRMGENAPNLVSFDFVSGETIDFDNIWQMIEPDLIELL